MYDDQQRTAPHASPGGRVFLHQFRHSTGRGPLVVFAAIAGLLGIAVGVASLTFFLSYRSTVTAQMRQLQQAVANAQAGNQGNAQQLNGLSNKITGIDAGMAAIAPFSQVCSTDLTGPAGPAQFWFACSDQRPGG
jgi:uncharacterized protein HemX